MAGFPYRQVLWNGSAILQNTTVYGCLGMGGGNNPDTTEANAQYTLKFGYTLTNLRTYVFSNSLTGNLVNTVRKNTAAGNCTVTHSGGVIGQQEDTTHTDTFVSGDLIAMQYVAVAGGTSATVSMVEANITPSSAQTVVYVSSRPTGRVFSTNSTVDPIYTADGLDAGITEANQQTTWRTAGTIANYSARASANTRTANDVTCGIRKNGVSGNSLVTFGAGASYQQDTTHTDTLVSGDLVNGHNTKGTGTGSFTMTLQSFEFTPTSGTDVQYVVNGGANVNVSLTRWVAISGTQAANSSEATAQSKMYQTVTFNLMRLKVTANTLTLASTGVYSFRKNTANGNQTLTYTAGQTGFQEDTTHTDTVVTGDLVNLQIVTGSTGTAINAGNWAMNGTYQLIGFDAVANSGYQAAASTYTFNRTVTGANTYLTVDVALLSAGQTVTSIVDDNGGGNVAMTFLGAQSTVSSVGRVESWGLVAPTAGTKQIQVNLSGSIASAAVAVSYTNVHQSFSTEGFNGNQATNVGATDATVAVTPVADNTWIHAAIATNDTAITANQTSRNNVTGVGGSGANEDTGPITPAAVTTMSYTNVGAVQTWAIVGYALRPLTASNATAVSLDIIPQIIMFGGTH